MKRWAVAGSLGLHAAVAAFVLWPREPRLLPPAEPPLIEVEMVREDATTKGAPATPAEAPPASDPAPPPVAPEPDAEMKPPPPPAPQTRATRTPAPAPEVNLGDSDETREALSVTGDHVVPPKPDSRFHNRPPGYPADAARRGAEGTVELLLHVDASGAVADVRVVQSTGTPSLDHEALTKVILWRFTPARDSITHEPVAFDYSVKIRFVIGDK